MAGDAPPRPPLPQDCVPPPRPPLPDTDDEDGLFSGDPGDYKKWLKYYHAS